MSPKILSYLDRHLPRRLNLELLEVGSMDVTGSARKTLLQRGFYYTGADIAPGPNVDVVVDKSCVWNLNRSFDVILSLNTFEHVETPWVLLETMARHLQRGGLIIVVAPFSFQHHRHPVDTFRYAPDGMVALAKYAGLVVEDAYLDYEAGATHGTASDIVWLCRRSRFSDAFAKVRDWWTRPPAINCIATMRRGA